MKKNLIDQVVSYFSPESGAKRAKARMIEQVVTDRLTSKRKYEGASSGRRTDGWFTMSTSANAETRKAVSKLRDRSRDLVRNNPYAAKAIEVIEGNVVGTGIMLQIKDKSKGRADRFQNAWKQWAESTECDVNGVHNFYGIQALAMRAIAESGEVLIRRVFVQGQAIPIQLQILEPDHLDSSKNGVTAQSGIASQGVQYDLQGRITGYWIFPTHPGDSSSVTGGSLKSIFVSAQDLRHIYRVDRPGQSRGVPWAAGVIIRMQDLDEYMDATVVKQKVSAAWAAFVKEPDGFQTDPSGAQTSISEKMEPGSIEILPPGKDIVFPTMPTTNDFGGFTAEILHSIAAGFGVTYESLTGDYSKVNFSSGRMGWLEFHRNVEKWRWQMVIPRACDPVFKWFLEAALIAGVDSMPPTGRVWTPPRREMIDPSSEYSSMVTAIRSGLSTQSESLRELGLDPDEVFEEIKRDNEKFDKLGLILDSDPRKVMKAGIVQTYVSNSKGEDEVLAPPEPIAPPPSEAQNALDAAKYFVDENEKLWRQKGDVIEKV